jgi:hypothetical protein
MLTMPSVKMSAPRPGSAYPFGRRHPGRRHDRIALRGHAGLRWRGRFPGPILGGFCGSLRRRRVKDYAALRTFDGTAEQVFGNAKFLGTRRTGNDHVCHGGKITDRVGAGYRSQAQFAGFLGDCGNRAISGKRELPQARAERSSRHQDKSAGRFHDRIPGDAITRSSLAYFTLRIGVAGVSLSEILTTFATHSS